MERQGLKYLLLDPLPILREAFYQGIDMLKASYPQYSWIGKELNSREAREALKEDPGTAPGYQLIWLHLDPAKQEKENPFKLLAAWQLHSPEAHIVVSLQQATIYLIRKVLQKVNPHGMLALVDCEQAAIGAALTAVLRQEVFYSKTVLLLLHTFFQTFEAMDRADYAILHEMDKGTPITQLPEKVLLSHSSILNRRIKLKALFDLEGKTDAHLLQQAKKLGYI